MRQKGNFSIILLVVVFFLALVGGLFLLRANKVIAPISTNEPVATSLPITSQEATISGKVIKNDASQLHVDGAAVLIIETIHGETHVTYFPGDAPCKNIKTENDGLKIKEGDQVEVYGKYTSQGNLFTCDSTDYYIRKIN